MKKLSPKLITLPALLIATVFAKAEDAIQYNFIDGSGDMDNAARYDPQTAFVDLSSKDVYVDGAYDNSSDPTKSFYIVPKRNAPTTVNSFTIQNFTGGTRYMHMYGASDFIVNEDFKYTVGNYWLGFRVQNVAGAGKSNITIGGQLYYAAQDTRSQFWLGFGSDYFKSLTVGSYSTTRAAIQLNGGYFSTNMGTADKTDINTADINIKGYVEMTSTSKWSLLSIASLQTAIHMNGLKGGGLLFQDVGSTNLALSTIVFKTGMNEVYDFKGSIISGTTSNNAANTSSQVNIVMDGQGKQILRLSGSGSAVLTSNITVNSGTMLLNYTGGLKNNTDEKKYNQLILNGGIFGLAAESTPTEGDLEMGDAYFNDIVWNGGKILLTFDSASNYYSNIKANSLVVTGDTAEFIFDSLESDWSVIEIELSDFLDIANLSDSEIAKFSGKSKDGSWAANFYKDSITSDWMISFAQVPEPSTVAAILGALALAFAAYRRRK